MFLSFGFTVGVCGQSTPDTLARQLVEAINRGDRSAIEDLFHPSTKEFYRNDSPETLDKQIDNLLEKKISGSYETTVTGIEEVEQYDLKTDSYTLLGIKLKFSKRPDIKLDIDQTEIIKNSQGREIEVKIRGISEMIIQKNARWYIIRPNVNTAGIKVRQKN